MNAAIYTIAKNESHNVEQFMSSCEGASVYVLDTGSNDDTVALLQKHGATVKQQTINPWRFDNARNEALSMVPDSIDVCLSLDMDEVLEENWTTKLKQEWTGNFGNYRYIADWQDESKTIPSVITTRTRIHSRQGFRWHRRVHELIKPIDGFNVIPFETSILVKHYRDNKQRNYDGALDQLIEDDPTDSLAWLQRAGERYEKKRWSDALEDYKMYFKITQDDETPLVRNRKAHAWIEVAICHHHLKNFDSSYRAFLSAVAVDPTCREAWTHFAHITSQIGNVPLAYGAAMTADSIKSPPSYATIDVAQWNNYPKELADSMFSLLLKGQ